MRRMASHASPPSAVQKSRSDTSQSKGSDFISSSSMNDNNVLAELVEELIEYTLFKNPLEILLAEEATTRGKSLIEIDKGDRSEDTPWIQLTNIVCQNIIVWITVMGATLSIMMMLLFLLNSYIRRWQPLYPAAHEKYDVFMTGQAYCWKSTTKNFSKLCAEHELLSLV